MAPAGTVTVTLVAVDAVTVAPVAPKNTILLPVVVLKLVPVIVTDVPGAALIGLKDVIVGEAADFVKLRLYVLIVPF